MNNNRANKVLGVASTIAFIESLLVIVGIFIIGENWVAGLILIIEGLFVPGLICPIIEGHAELIEKTSNIEELLRNSMIPQENTISQNLYNIGNEIYTRNQNSYNQEEIALNYQILETLKSIEAKLETKPNKQKTKSKKEK